MKEIQAQGLYATLRIGPFIEAEWTYGGLPFWLHDIPGIVFRSDNQPFKDHMQRFVSKIVNMMKSEKLYASQGGPIIISQIENEYQTIEAAFHEKGPRYVRWAAAMAVSLQTGVPWVMCKQMDAPDPVVSKHTIKYKVCLKNQKFNSIERWEEYKETIATFDKTSLRAKTLLDHMSTTKDTSDYLWYTFRFQNNFSDAQPVIRARSHGHVLHAYVNGVYAGSAHGNHKNTSFTLENSVYLRNGTNNVAFLSVTVGLPDSGAYLERKVAGLHTVRIQHKDFTNYKWGYQVGLLGEKLQIYTDDATNKVQWNKFGSSTYQPLIWYKTLFDAPSGNDPVALNLSSMGKGEVWVNGQSIGRYWVSFHTPKGKPSQKVCIGKRKCSIFQSNQFFDGDPCPGIPKALLVEAKCT
ncbi:hypothetical protein GH714_001335 [Hevea brasiliensis]|uniref:beta-galactosidase n=1 Tax=Hevea brasiliensis TaxID=3981 RepID=A0A6A6L5R2_HEVBR|nr:hypothetical protein GH714_001335 [Hevea brasiliensis]